MSAADAIPARRAALAMVAMPSPQRFTASTAQIGGPPHASMTVPLAQFNCACICPCAPIRPAAFPLRAAMAIRNRDIYL